MNEVGEINKESSLLNNDATKPLQEEGNMIEDDGSKFVWHVGTGLYFHSGSGFYHDPNAGWYYSSRDGLYYKFHNGRYLPLEMDTSKDFHTSIDCAVNHTELPNGGTDSHPVAENSSVTTEENNYPLWYYDYNLSEYWYFDKESKAYYKYDQAAKRKHEHGLEGNFMASNSICLNNLENKDNDKSKSPYDNPNEKQSAVEVWPYEGSFLKVEPTDSTGENAAKGSIEDKDTGLDAANLREELAEGGDLQRPSEWIEEVLINLYLQGYSTLEHHIEEPPVTSNSNDADIAIQERDKEIEEGEWVPEDTFDRSPLSPRKETEENDCPYSVQAKNYDFSKDNSVGDTDHFNSESECLSDEDRNLRDEENWRAQYGQVVRPTEDASSSFSALDLWDWAMVVKCMKGKKGESARLVGRLAPRSKILHPSIQGGGSLLKTGAICEVHLDLVRVSSGQIYRLRCPSARYVASLRTFNSSNPTQDWGFPPLQFTDSENILEDIVGDSHPTNASYFCEDSTLSKPFVPNLVHQHCLARKRQKDTWMNTRIKAYNNKELRDAQLRKERYKDRAAERRILHGGIGIGPGQKNANTNDWDLEICSTAELVDSSGEETPHYAFGVGSIARRLLEGMGWKEGESLGNKKDGLISPLHTVGNKGHFGLGWTS